jgi:hypothetical protein
MKLAKDIYEGIISNYELLRTQLDQLKSMQSMLDKELSKIYHEIEVTKFNASEGFKYAKRIQEITQTRRVVKSELLAIQSIVKHLPFKELDNITYKKNKKQCLHQIQYHTDYDKNDWYNNFGIKAEDIAM